MRQSRRRSTIPTSALFPRRRSSLRASLGGAIALLLFVVSLFLAPPHGPRIAHQGLGAVAAASDCVSHDPTSPPGERPGACLAGALCCATGCDASTPIGVPTARQALALPATPEDGPARRSACADRLLALAGWASAWSSRAPPPRA